MGKEADVALPAEAAPVRQRGGRGATPGRALPPKTIAVIPGDGIGTEVMPAALRVLDRVCERFAIELDYQFFPDWSCERYLRTGAMMPEDGLEQLARCDAILLGAVGDPRVPDHASLWGLLIPIRRQFHQYINLRPIVLLDGVQGPLRGVASDQLDFIVVRENSEGEYSEVGGRLWKGEPDEVALQTAAFSRRASSRAIRYAFDLAQSRRHHLVAATKSNGIVHTMPFWDAIVREEAASFPDVNVEIVHVDALAARFVSSPGSLDVVVGSNLFGDILSDLGAALVGSIGVAASANLNPTKEQPSMFEPVHGSAPDIAYKGIANPIGQILSAAMMLRHLGYEEADAAVQRAVRAVTAAGKRLTRDLGGCASTDEAAEAIVAEI